MKKTHRQQGRHMIDVRIDPVVNEGPGTVRVMVKQIRRLEDEVRRKEDEISSLRQLLNSQTVIEHWEVPG